MPRLQDAPVIIFTMGKVGTITLQNSIQSSGALFTRTTHYLHSAAQLAPHYTKWESWHFRMLRITKRFHIAWLRGLPRVRYVTAVREPISRFISFYCYEYFRFFGEEFTDTPMETLLDNFPRNFEHDYGLPLVPGRFFGTEIQCHLGVNVYDYPSPREDGIVVIEKERTSLLVVKLEISDERKAAALSSWMGKPITISRANTAADEGYLEKYEVFKRRVRIAYRYAEDSYMGHFYTPEERAKFWKRWEPQLDHSILLPEWVEDQLNKFHPPVDHES